VSDVHRGGDQDTGVADHEAQASLAGLRPPADRVGAVFERPGGSREADRCDGPPGAGGDQVADLCPGRGGVTLILEGSPGEGWTVPSVVLYTGARSVGGTVCAVDWDLFGEEAWFG